ncbi:glutathione S-transferase family protein [Spongiibacter sp. KMU-166]|uniref:Glutathione S-transferase family protein n=1 Tax=Spongiibacter thalassae TaxID=2721624 RepID=A0ABX1GE62_9GAMM|nr:glutathione S-transferase family protein [Spongiibacter thalassae]NKI16677.1 glutathione S-transferase family protein [Spongiibacter thalassae]
MAATLILHHYDLSPFSQKIRSQLGYYSLDWQSVRHAPMPPRSTLAQLANGYRRLPVAQLGADIFCDTQLIANEVIRLARGDEAARNSDVNEDHTFIAYLDGECFFQSLVATAPIPLIKTLLHHYSMGDVLRLLGDRARLLRRGAVMPPVPGIAARGLRKHLLDLDRRLGAQPYLAGDSPGVADFAAYHSLWFYCRMSARTLPTECAAVRRWYDSIVAFGEGGRSEISASEALAVAQTSEPRPLPQSQISDHRLGQWVSITPEDYAREPVTGKLVACTHSRWIVRVDSFALGVLHVHLPKRGYAIGLVDPEEMRTAV